MSSANIERRAGDSRVTRRRRRMRDALLAAGARQFARQGIDTVSVEELLNEADVSRATFYALFSSKYSLLEAILNPIFESAIESMRGLASCPPEAALDGITETYLELWRRHRDGLTLIPSVDRRTFEHFASQHRLLNEAMLEVLSRAERADLLRNGSAHYSLKVIARTAIPLLRVYGNHPAAEALFTDAMKALLVRTG